MKLKRPSSIPEKVTGKGGRYDVICFYPPHYKFYTLGIKLRKAQAIEIADSVDSIEVTRPVPQTGLKAYVHTGFDRENEVYVNAKVREYRAMVVVQAEPFHDSPVVEMAEHGYVHFKTEQHIHIEIEQNIDTVEKGSSFVGVKIGVL